MIFSYSLGLHLTNHKTQLFPRDPITSSEGLWTPSKSHHLRSYNWSPVSPHLPASRWQVHPFTPQVATPVLPAAQRSAEQSNFQVTSVGKHHRNNPDGCPVFDVRSLHATVTRSKPAAGSPFLGSSGTTSIGRCDFGPRRPSRLRTIDRWTEGGSSGRKKSQFFWAKT